MTNEKIAVKITEQEQRNKSLQHRVDRLEEQQKSTNQLVRSVDRLAQSMETMAEEQQRQGEKIDKLEKRKADSMRYWIRTIITALATGIIGYVLARVFV